MADFETELNRTLNHTALLFVQGKDKDRAVEVLTEAGLRLVHVSFLQETDDGQG